MSWEYIEARWSELVTQVKALWPETDLDLLKEAGGAEEPVVAHLADRHELTRAEARDLLEARLLPAATSPIALAAE